MMGGAPLVGGSKGIGCSTVGKGCRPGVARSRRHSDTARTGHGSHATSREAGKGQRYPAAAGQRGRGGGRQRQRGPDLIHTDGAICCCAVVVPISGVGGGEGVGRAASRQLRRPGAAFSRGSMV